MKALVYHGPNEKAWDEVPDPKLIDEHRCDRPGRRDHHLRE